MGLVLIGIGGLACGVNRADSGRAEGKDNSQSSEADIQAKFANGFHIFVVAAGSI